VICRDNQAQPKGLSRDTYLVGSAFILMSGVWAGRKCDIFDYLRREEKLVIQAPRVLSSGILLGSEVFNIEGEKLGK
jgi:hypothetical protein